MSPRQNFGARSELEAAPMEASSVRLFIGISLGKRRKGRAAKALCWRSTVNTNAAGEDGSRVKLQLRNTTSDRPSLIPVISVLIDLDQFSERQNMRLSRRRLVGGSDRYPPESELAIRACRGGINLASFAHEA